MNLFGRGKRRNPTVLGLKLEDGLAGALAGYGVKAGGDAARHVVPQAAKALDDIRPGLSTPVSELVAAVVVNKLVDLFSFTRKYRVPAALGAAVIVVNDTLLAATGQVNLIGGTPSWALGWKKDDQKLLGAGASDQGVSASAALDRSYGPGF